MGKIKKICPICKRDKFFQTKTKEIYCELCLNKLDDYVNNLSGKRER